MERNERCNALIELLKVVRQDMQSRRSYEWRVALTLWSGLALLMGFLLTQFPSERIHFDILTMKCLVGAIGFLLFLLHWWWSRYIIRNHRRDLEMTFEYEDQIRYFANFSFPDLLQKNLKGVRDKLEQWHSNVTSITLLLVSFFLLVALFSFLFLGTMMPQPGTKAARSDSPSDQQTEYVTKCSISCH